MTFQFHALNEQEFSHLYGLNDKALNNLGILSYIADTTPGYPCRITLEDVQPGERLFLINYEHLSANTPYRSAHAIFVKDGAISKKSKPNTIPDMIFCRLVSIRAFNSKDMMIDAIVSEGSDIYEQITNIFSISDVSYLHVHTAKRGCYLALVTRS